MALVLLIAPAASKAAGLNERLAALSQAVELGLRADPAAERTGYPTELRRILWFALAGDDLPDAIVILKPRKDDCAVGAVSERTCKAMLFAGTPAGGFRLVAEFSYLVHPVVLRWGSGGIDEMYHTRDIGSEPIYQGYSLAEGQPTPTGRRLSQTEVFSLPSIVVDDRSLPTLAEQRYAAHQFDNSKARLAPFRLHLDTINQALRRLGDSEAHDGAFEERARYLAEGLTSDVAQIVRAIGWNQTLEVRVWSCLDWMVPRRFWEIEERRPGRIGLCEPHRDSRRPVGLSQTGMV